MVEGTSLHFNVTCSFYDDKDNIHDCTKAIVDKTETTPIVLYIEFVTLERQVTYKFSMNNFQIMLDTMNYFNILCLPEISSQYNSENNTNLLQIMVQC